MEVQVREMCPSFECAAGFNTTTKKPCTVCEGKGYLYDWIDVRAMLLKVIKEE